MSTLDLTPDEFRSLESLRQRLATLASNLHSLQETILRSNPSLPSASSLQASARIAQQNLFSLQTLLSDRQDLFARLAVHPSTNFPGRLHEGVLQTVLRKKLEPDVEGWVEECREAAAGAGVEVGGRFARGGGGRREEDEEDDDEEDEDEEGYRPEDEEDVGAGDPLTDLWADVRDACLARIKEFVTGESQDVYTVAEREAGVENVRTGLRRNLDEEEEEESEEEDDEEGEKDGDDDVAMVGSGNALVARPKAIAAQSAPRPRVGLEHLLWFGARGDFDLPHNIELESAKRAAAGAGRRAGSG